MRIQTERVVCNHKTFGQCHIVLALLNLRIVKLFDFAAIKAHHVVVVLPFVELIHRFATFKVVATEQTCLLKLR
jgi:hypothetical protein